MESNQDGYGSLAYLINIVRMQPNSPCPLLKFPVSAVTKHGDCWLQFMWNQPTLHQKYAPIYEMETILPGISIFGIDSPLPNRK